MRALSSVIRALTSAGIVALITLALAFTVAEAFYFICNGHLAANRALAARGNDPMSYYRTPFRLEKGTRTRILAVGGSTTYGQGVAPDQAWPAIFQRLLEKEHPDSFEVINLGRLGGHLDEFIVAYQAAPKVYISRDAWMDSPLNRPRQDEVADWGWKDLNPDLVLVAPVVNDTAPDFLYHTERTPVSNSAHSIRMLLNDSLLVQHTALGVYLALALQKMDFANRRPIPNEDMIPAIRAGYAERLQRFLALWKDDAHIYLLGLPLLFNPGDGEKEARLAARVFNADPVELASQAAYLPLLEVLEREVRAAISANMTIPCYEIGEELKSNPFSRRVRLYHDSIHMNENGEELVAKEIYNKLAPFLEHLALMHKKASE